MNHTLAVIKPNVIEFRKLGEVLRLIETQGFILHNMIYEPSADIDFVKEFYKEHEGKDFYDKLVNGMANRPWLAIRLTHRTEDSIKKWRYMMREIREDYSGLESYDNAVHGSDSMESAKREIALIFNDEEDNG